MLGWREPKVTSLSFIGWLPCSKWIIWRVLGLDGAYICCIEFLHQYCKLWMYYEDCVYLMYSGRLPWHRSIWLLLVAILRPSPQEARISYHVPFPWVLLPRSRQLSSWYLDSIHCRRIDFQSCRKFVMWDFPDQSFTPFPSFVETFRFKLGEGCEITSEFCRFRWREVLRKELICHLIPCCYGILK